MNIFVIILLVIVGVIALLLIIALISRKDYQLRREVIINRPRQEVFDYIKHLKNQDHFSKWVMQDPNMKREFRGTDGTVGFIYAWEGNSKVGSGEQEIKGIREGELLDVEIRFVKPMPAVGRTPMTTETVGDGQTKVTWGMSSRMNFPFNIMLLLGMEKMLGKDVEISLQNLKRILEK